VEGEEEAHDSARDFDVGTARVFVSSKGDGEALMESIPGELLVMIRLGADVVMIDERVSVERERERAGDRTGALPGEWVVSTAAVSTVIVGALGRLAGASESMIAD
jgi:hypothetical protein